MQRKSISRVPRLLAFLLAMAMAMTTLSASVVAAGATEAGSNLHSDGAACAAARFADLDMTQWYHESVDFVLEKGLMKGTGANTFAPLDPASRAMVVTILHRMEGSPVSSAAAAFRDVAESQWYTESVSWAAENGIVQGHNGLFDPNGFVTREQLASILFRYARFRGLDVSVYESTNILSFEDALDVSEYAFSAMRWACGAGILNGTNGKLLPQGNAQRCQLAAMLMRFSSMEEEGNTAPESSAEESSGNFPPPGNDIPLPNPNPESPSKPEEDVTPDPELAATVDVSVQDSVVTETVVYAEEGVEITYTYDDFKHLISEAVFEMYNAQYLKIAVGKGQITWEDIEALIEFYYSLDITPLQ